MPRASLALALCVASAPAWSCLAQDGQAQDPSSEVTIGQRSEDQDPLSGRRPLLPYEPVRTTGDQGVQQAHRVPRLTLDIDPRVLGVAPGDPLPRLRREGESIRRRDGRLLPAEDRGYAVIILDADPEDPDEGPIAMIVAPCITLESMERMLEEQGEDLRFTVTGQVHTYRGVNFLMPTSQPRPFLVTGEAEQQTEEPQQAQPVEETSAEEGPTDEPAGEEGEETNPGATPSVDDVLNQLIEQRTTAPSQPDGDISTTEATPGVYDAQQDLLRDPLLYGLDPDRPVAELMEEGQFVVARTGRLVRSGDGSQALFVFDADHAGAPEAPVIVHACRLLEMMEDTVLEQGDDVPFVVTGQVYVYRGANYLLPTIVRREFDRGNLE